MSNGRNGMAEDVWLILVEKRACHRDVERSSSQAGSWLFTPALGDDGGRRVASFLRNRVKTCSASGRLWGRAEQKRAGGESPLCPVDETDGRVCGRLVEKDGVLSPRRRARILFAPAWGDDGLVRASRILLHVVPSKGSFRGETIVGRAEQLGIGVEPSLPSR